MHTTKLFIARSGEPKNIRMKKTFIFLLAVYFFTTAFAQPGPLPLKEWYANTQAPFIFYISGDGGFNNFSNGLCNAINKEGYSITSLNSRSYFWNKKTPQQTANDIVAYLETQFKKRENQQFALVGYSFGADVLPFIVNRLPAAIKNKLVSVVMLAPSTSTDFVIYLTDMFGTPKKRSMDVVTEINNIGLVKTVIISDDKENSFPYKNVRLKNFSSEVLQGNHHFDGGTNVVAKTILKYLR